MVRSWVVSVLAWGGMLGAHGCHREAAPASVVAGEVEGSQVPEPLLLEPLTHGRSRADRDPVELPPAPSIARVEVPERYDDGAYSIAGLRQDLEARVAEGEAGQEIILRAWVTEIYVPAECPKGTVCPPPKQPHLWLADGEHERGRRWALLLVDYQFTIPEWETMTWKGQPRVVMEVGRRYTIKGRFARFSDTGFAADQGLLDFVAYRPLDPKTGEERAQWVYPPGAPWHPLTIEQQEALNRELIERSKPRK